MIAGLGCTNVDDSGGAIGTPIVIVVVLPLAIHECHLGRTTTNRTINARNAKMAKIPRRLFTYEEFPNLIV